MFQYVIESIIGLFWALLILIVLFAHYTMCVDIPTFRYIDF